MKPLRNLWPLGVFGALGIFLFGTIALIVVASAQKTDLVSRDYYEQELKYQARIESISRAQKLGDRAGIAFERADRTLAISLPPEHVRAGLQGRIEFYRPSSAGLDRQLPLAPNAGGVQSVNLTNLPRGLWEVRVTWTVQNQEYWLLRKITNSAP
jgi:hypothetical protein